MAPEHRHHTRNGPGLVVDHLDVVGPQEEIGRTGGNVARGQIERRSVEPDLALLDVDGSTLDSPMKENTKGEFGVS